MTFRKIRNELEKIYQERKRWDGSKGLFTESTITQRKLILIKQQVLYQIEDARLAKNKGKESFNPALYKVINKYLRNYKRYE